MAPQVEAATISEIFLRLPSAECGGYSQVEREEMLQTALAAEGTAGRAAPPDPNFPFIRHYATNLLVLSRPGYGDITYKLFDGYGFQLLSICRGRLRRAPIDPVCTFGLCLYRSDNLGVLQVELTDYLPAISILDYITADTLRDPRATRDILAKAQIFNECLECRSSSNDRLALEINASTTIDASSCANFLPTFGILPLRWNGLTFTKPYDRAAPRPLEAQDPLNRGN